MPHVTEREWREIHYTYRNARRTNFHYYRGPWHSQYERYATQFASSRHQNKNRRIDMRYDNKVKRRNLRLSLMPANIQHTLLVVTSS